MLYWLKMCKDTKPNILHLLDLVIYRYEQPGVWTKTDGTKITKPGAARGDVIETFKIMHGF